MGLPFGNKNGQAGNADGRDKNGQPELPDGQQAAAKKTTPDEGKTFEADTVFVCVQDCFQNGRRYHRGDAVTGKKCPPWFVVKASEDSEEELEGLL